MIDLNLSFSLAHSGKKQLVSSNRGSWRLDAQCYWIPIAAGQSGEPLQQLASKSLTMLDIDALVEWDRESK